MVKKTVKKKLTPEEREKRSLDLAKKVIDKRLILEKYTREKKLEINWPAFEPYKDFLSKQWSQKWFWLNRTPSEIRKVFLDRLDFCNKNNLPYIFAWLATYSWHSVNFYIDKSTYSKDNFEVLTKIRTFIEYFHEKKLAEKWAWEFIAKNRFVDEFKDKFDVNQKIENQDIKEVLDKITGNGWKNKG